jgi:hypothetical protein
MIVWSMTIQIHCSKAIETYSFDHFVSVMRVNWYRK